MTYFESLKTLIENNNPLEPYISDIKCINSININYNDKKEVHGIRFHNIDDIKKVDELTLISGNEKKYLRIHLI